MTRTTFKPLGNDTADQAFLDFADAVDAAHGKAVSVSLSISDERIRDEFIDMLDDYLESQINFRRALRMKTLLEAAADYADEDAPKLTPKEQKAVEDMFAAYVAEFGGAEAKKKKRNNKNKKKLTL